MSIYGSFCSFDEDDGWGNYPAPLAYAQSHVLPQPGDPRGGSFDLGCINGFITCSDRESSPDDDDAYWPYLRVSLTGVDPEPDTIVLDADQATTLRDCLTGWLERVDRTLIERDRSTP